MIMETYIEIGLALTSDNIRLSYPLYLCEHGKLAPRSGNMSNDDFAYKSEVPPERQMPRGTLVCHNIAEMLVEDIYYLIIGHIREMAVAWWTLVVVGIIQKGGYVCLTKNIRHFNTILEVPRLMPRLQIRPRSLLDVF